MKHGYTGLAQLNKISQNNIKYIGQQHTNIKVLWNYMNDIRELLCGNTVIVNCSIYKIRPATRRF